LGQETFFPRTRRRSRCPSRLPFPPSPLRSRSAFPFGNSPFLIWFLPKAPRGFFSETFFFRCPTGPRLPQAPPTFCPSPVYWPISISPLVAYFTRPNPSPLSTILMIAAFSEVPNLDRPLSSTHKKLAIADPFSRDTSPRTSTSTPYNSLLVLPRRLERTPALSFPLTNLPESPARLWPNDRLFMISLILRHGYSPPSFSSRYKLTLSPP